MPAIFTIRDNIPQVLEAFTTMLVIFFNLIQSLGKDGLGNFDAWRYLNNMIVVKGCQALIRNFICHAFFILHELI